MLLLPAKCVLNAIQRELALMWGFPEGQLLWRSPIQACCAEEYKLGGGRRRPPQTHTVPQAGRGSGGHLALSKGQLACQWGWPKAVELTGTQPRTWRRRFGTELAKLSRKREPGKPSCQAAETSLESRVQLLSPPSG